VEHVVFSKRSCPRLARPNVNRQLEQLKIANMIRISGTEISIIDEKALVNIAEVPSSRD
jgi:hypothetical protein